MVKKVGKYELGRSLGEGTFGKVKYALDTENNQGVAIKILDKEKIQKQNMGNQIKKEISIMKMVKHKYVVEMIEVLASKTKIFIVLELVTGGELFDKIVQVGKLNEQQARFYFQQLVEGIEYCHKLGVCHRDLKPENLLLDEHGNLKISDFGLSSLYVGDENDGTARTELLHTTCGTPNYVAPEVLSDKGYDGKKADVWSIGVILYVLLAGFLPFDESTIVQLFAKIQAADFTYPSWFTPDVRSLLNQMLVADPKERSSLAQIQHYKWYIGGGEPGAPAQYHGGSARGGASSSAAAGAAAEVPTPAQLEAASNHMTEDLDDDDENGKEVQTPVALNAFDLVGQCGGFMLDRMFSPEIFYSAAMEDTLKKNPTAEQKELGGALLFGSQTVKSKIFHFSSSQPAAELTSAVYEALLAMGFDFEVPQEVIVRSGSLKATLLSAKGMLGMFVQVFTLSPSLTLLEIKKGKGDILEWNNAFSELVEKRIASLINKPAPAAN